MKTMKILCCVLALAGAPILGLTGCMGDKTHESTGEYVDDTTITAHVKSALSNDSFKYPDVKVETFKGTVQLSGFVDSREQKSRAGDLAKGIQGVKDVENNITVKG